MLNQSIQRHARQWLLMAALLGLGALAQAEPTLKQVNDAAQSGQLKEAQLMMQQVLVAHPESAKAHFVQAELFSRQGQLGRAREALAAADKLSPGLAFAKPEAVQQLRAQLAATTTAATAAPARNNAPSMGQPASTPSAFPWGLALILGGALIAFGIFMLRKKPAPAAVYGNANAMSNGLNGPQNFGSSNGMGNGNGMGSGGMAAPYGQPGYGQPAYGQPAGSGLGGRVMGGLATGLAVGAGVMAAQAIGNSLMGGDHRAHQPDGAANNDYAPSTANADMGGQNFGIADSGSWDDGNAMASSDGGGDWDS